MRFPGRRSDGRPRWRMPRRTPAALAVAALAGLVGVVLPVAPASAETNGDYHYEEVVLNYTGGFQDVPIPSWSKSAIVVAVGGYGGSTPDTWGGRGTRVQGTIATNGFGKITVGIGGAGRTRFPYLLSGPFSAEGGWGGGAAHGGAAYGESSYAKMIAGGGGATNVMLRGLEVIVAGGGGGAGMSVNATGGEGGGDSAGHQGHGILAAKGGAGGTFASRPGRIGGDSLPGGIGSGGGGGGGGGYVGGGAGQMPPMAIPMGGAGGGAAGTTWTSDLVTNVFTSTSDPGGPGGNGHVKIFFRNWY